MKKFFIGLLAIGSFFAFAQDIKSIFKEILITPTLKRSKILVVFVDYKDLKFDASYTHTGEISADKLEELRLVLGDRRVEEILQRQAEQRQFFEKRLDLRDPIEQVRLSLNNLKEYLEETSYNQFSIDYDFARVMINKSYKEVFPRANQVVKEANIALANANIDKNKFAKTIFINAPVPQTDIGELISEAVSIGGNDAVIATQHLLPNRIDPSAIIHEFGHLLGLPHSLGLDCKNKTVDSSCRSIPYGNFLDVMGGNDEDLGHISSFNKEKLGWLTKTGDKYIETVTSAGIYEIGSLEQDIDGRKAIKMKLSNFSSHGDSSSYWVYFEYRTPNGFGSSIKKHLGDTKGLLTLNVVKVNNLNEGFEYTPFLLLDILPSQKHNIERDRPSYSKILKGEVVQIKNIEFRVLELDANSARVEVLKL